MWGTVLTLYSLTFHMSGISFSPSTAYIFKGKKRCRNISLYNYEWEFSIPVHVSQNSNTSLQEVYNVLA